MFVCTGSDLNAVKISYFSLLMKKLQKRESHGGNLHNLNDTPKKNVIKQLRNLTLNMHNLLYFRLH